MFLNTIPLFLQRDCFLRASGGVSIRPYRTYQSGKFSPRKRRCFFTHFVTFSPRKVFSAQAEVFPAGIRPSARPPSFLRASGGVSLCHHSENPKYQFSPRKRRCFPPRFRIRLVFSVFSAQAEVFPKNGTARNHGSGFLRASGGVSLFLCMEFVDIGFSPRKRRCFHRVGHC